MCYFLFNLTGLILTVRTLQDPVGAVPEAFRMLCVCQLPVQQYYAGCEEQTPAEETADKKHRGEHHKMPPVIDTAVNAALILHNKGLERAEQKDTYVITEEIENCEHEQISISYDPKQVKNAPEAVKNQPYQHNLPGFEIHALNKLQKLVL